MDKTQTLARSKAIIVNICLLIISLAVTLLLAEFVIRALGIQKIVRLNPDIYKISENPIISYELRPNYKGETYGVAVQTNSAGMLGREYSRQKPPDTIRIALVGDSVVFGIGVGMEDNTASSLERVLNQTSSAKKYEVLNFGVPSYNTEQEREVVKSKVLGFEPDLILLVFVSNDLDPTLRLNERNYFTTDDELQAGQLPRAETYDNTPGIKKWLDRNSCLYRFLRVRYDNLARLVGIRPPLVDEPDPRYAGATEESKQLWAKGQYNLLEIKRLADSIGAQFVIIEWQHNQALQGEATRILRQFCQQNEIPFLDLAPILIDRPGGYAQLSLGWDSHPSKRGHEIIAGTIAEFLQDNKLLGAASRE
jgi:lysophospholipase L1-like esterase